MGTAPATSTPNSPAAGAKPEPDDARKKLRQYERKSVAAVVIVHELGPDGTVGAGIDASGFDFSRSGMGIHVNRLLHPGKQILIRLKVLKSQDKIMYGIVRNVNYENGTCQTGVEFTAQPDTPNLKRWLESQGLA